MAFYRTTIYKRFNGSPFDGETWSNVYWIDAADAETALSKGIAIATLEMSVSYSAISVTKVTAVSKDSSSDKATGFPGSSGALDPTGLGGYLPLFNTVRVVLSDPIDRPEQKYLRLGAQAANLANGVWDTEFVDAVQEDYADNLLVIGNIIGPNGGTVDEATVLSKVQNRQQGWHRRTRPGFHRGWVPD